MRDTRPVAIVVLGSLLVIALGKPASAQVAFFRRSFERGTVAGSGGFSFSSSGGDLYDSDGERSGETATGNRVVLSGGLTVFAR